MSLYEITGATAIEKQLLVDLATRGNLVKNILVKQRLRLCEQKVSSNTDRPLYNPGAMNALLATFSPVFPTTSVKYHTRAKFVAEMTLSTTKFRSGLQRLRRSCYFHFTDVLRPYIQEFEEWLIEDGLKADGSPFLREIIRRLLKGCYKKRTIKYDCC